MRILIIMFLTFLLSACIGVSNEPHFDVGDLEKSGLTSQDNLFRLTLHMDKNEFYTDEKINISATLEYIGDQEQITIWHGEPYINFTISDGKKFNIGGIVLPVLKSTVLEKGKKYVFPFKKTGGFSEDDPDADFWKKFFQEKDLHLPEGEYTVTAYTDFSLSDDVVKDKYMNKVQTKIVVKSRDSAQSSTSALPPLPSEIQLSFKPLELKQLPLRSAATGWKLVKSIPFGKVNQKSLSLNIYKVDNDENSPTRYNGILKLEGKQYLIQFISSEFAQEHFASPTQIFQRFFPGQNQYELIGSIDLEANGPGLKLFIVYDKKNDKLCSFDEWGKPSFMDLDGDGDDEFIIEFPGLHLQPPDLSIIRTESGQLEISKSIESLVERSPGDYAELIRRKDKPIIQMSNMRMEHSENYDYIYDHGVLKQIKIEPEKPQKFAKGEIIIDTAMTVSSTGIPGTNNILRIRMVKGKYSEDWNPGAYRGTNYVGQFNFEVYNEIGEVIKTTKLSEFDHQDSTFTRTFQVVFDDYNGDGKLDFTIGQLLGSNGNIFKIFTIENDFEIKELPVKGRNEIYISDSRFSTKLQKDKAGTFYYEYYDQLKGKYMRNELIWQGNEFIVKPVGVIKQ